MSEPDATFPAGRADHLRVPAGLAAQRLRLRPAGEDDLPFLRRLYGETRAAELAGVPWPEAVREQFLDSQFALQHRHYINHFADADFLVLERGGDPVGRLYLQRAAPDFLIVDISLLGCVQGQGMGRGLIAAVQEMAVAEGSGVQLHVDVRNVDAQRLYRRLGFALLSPEPEGAHLRMRWPADAMASLS